MKKQQRGGLSFHPGRVLYERFLKPTGLSQNALARELGVPPRRINEIVLGKRGITADTALRIARYFKTTEQFWLNLQLAWDLYHATHSAAAKQIDQIKPLKRAG